MNKSHNLRSKLVCDEEMEDITDYDDLPLAQPMESSPIIVPDTDDEDVGGSSPALSEVDVMSRKRKGKEEAVSPPPAKKTRKSANPQKKVRFRLQSKRMLVTYKHHLRKADYEKWIRTKGPITFVRLAHENGDEKVPYLHTHVLVEFETPRDWSSQRCLDYTQDGESIHPNIKTLRSKGDFERAQNYIAKEDPENSDLKRENRKTMLDVVKNADSFQDLMAYTLSKDEDSWKHANALKTLWDNAGFVRIPKMSWTPQKDWQKELIQMVEEKPDPRTIIWIFDRKGNMGKTMMSKWFYSEDPQKWAIAKDMGTSRDSATIVQNWLRTGWNGYGVIVDLPRAAEKCQSRMYTYLEEIKDGFVTATKYSGGTCVFPSPHLVVFANWPPYVRAMSLDRWNIYEISMDGTMEETSTEELALEQEEKEAAYKKQY